MADDRVHSVYGLCVLITSGIALGRLFFDVVHGNARLDRVSSYIGAVVMMGLVWPITWTATASYAEIHPASWANGDRTSVFWGRAAMGSERTAGVTATTLGEALALALLEMKEMTDE